MTMAAKRLATFMYRIARRVPKHERRRGVPVSRGMRARLPHFPESPKDVALALTYLVAQPKKKRPDEPPAGHDRAVSEMP